MDSYIDHNKFENSGFAEYLIYLNGEEDYEAGVTVGYAIPSTLWDMVEVRYNPENKEVIRVKHYNDFGTSERFENLKKLKKYCFEYWNDETDLQPLEDVFKELEQLDWGHNGYSK